MVVGGNPRIADFHFTTDFRYKQGSKKQRVSAAGFSVAKGTGFATVSASSSLPPAGAWFGEDLLPATLRRPASIPRSPRLTDRTSNTGAALPARPEVTKRPDLTHKRTQPERAPPGIQRNQPVVDLRRSAGWWRVACQRPRYPASGQAWKPSVSLRQPSLVFVLCPLMRIRGAFRYFWPIYRKQGKASDQEILHRHRHLHRPATASIGLVLAQAGRRTMSISPARALTTLAFAAAMACGTPSQGGNPNPSKEELDRATQQLLDSFCGLNLRTAFAHRNGPEKRRDRTEFHATATASCHRAAASALKIRRVDRETRCR